MLIVALVSLAADSADLFVIDKSERRMILYDDGAEIACFRIAPGFAPEGDKERQGAGGTLPDRFQEPAPAVSPVAEDFLPQRSGESGWRRSGRGHLHSPHAGDKRRSLPQRLSCAVTGRWGASRSPMTTSSRSGDSSRPEWRSRSGLRRARHPGARASAPVTHPL
jgi:hypothetical protein